MKTKHTPVTVVKYPPIASGEPIVCDDGICHVKWTYQDGSTRITEFGWKDPKYAEHYVQTVMSDQEEAGTRGKG